MILAVDTSSAFTTIGIGDVDGPQVGVRAEGARRHAEEIDALFASAIAPALHAGPPVQAVAVGIGPGPYSGLRVGIAFGIGLARAWDVPIVGVCSLDARAWQVAHALQPVTSGEFTIATDARRREHYAARYRYDGGVDRLWGPTVSGADLPEPVHHDVEIDPAELAVRVAEYLGQGRVPQRVDGVLATHGDDASSYSLGSGPLFVPTPLYLRHPDITISGSVSP